MNQSIKKKHAPTRIHQVTKRWILASLLGMVLLLTASRLSPASASYAAGPENFQGNSSPTPTPTATATRPAKPTATQTAAPSSLSGVTVKVTGNSVNLRTGPGLDFGFIRKLAVGDVLTLQGRLGDNTWIYVQTADGQDGWIETTWADLEGVNVENYPIQTPSPFPDTFGKVSANKVNLRTGPGLVYEKMRGLVFAEEVMLLGRSEDNKWLYIKTTEDDQIGWIEAEWIDFTGENRHYIKPPVITAPPTPTSTLVVLEGVEGHWIDIDLSEQRLYAYDGPNLIASFLVSTGVEKYPTEMGKYRIQVKYRYSDMHGTGYFLPDVPWTMYYSGDFSIHGTYWHHSFGTRMSRGCVNMDISDAEWLYNFSEVGTLVNIHR